MSDQWEYFPCQMGEHTAFIFFDHGIARQIDDIAVEQLCKIRVLFKQPKENGLPTNEEFDALVAIEDDIEAFMAEHHGYYVGRITVDGARHFHCYIDLAEDDIRKFIANLREQHDYQLGYFVEQDSEKMAYWDELYPTKDDWQVISDIRVLDRLQEHGDNPQISRRVDHWIYFPEPGQRDAYCQWLESEGYHLQGMIEADEDQNRYGVQAYHESQAILQEISHHTLKLARKAEELAGDYDGWETSIEK